MKQYEPLPGNIIYEALKGQETIIMAANTRITKGVLKGIFRAAKDTDSPIIFELAKSEINLKDRYTGYTPETYSKITRQIAKEVGWDIWVLHADHISVKTGTQQEIKDVKELIKAQINAGFTSFALDPSHLFDVTAKTVKEQLQKNIDVTTELYEFIKTEMNGEEFGLEVEVGEVGHADTQGRVITSVEEAITFIQELKNNNVNPDLLAIANGSAHGVQIDENGREVKQLSIDLKRTNEIVEALKQKNLDVKIAQHGITGTPREMIYQNFNHGNILKGNVGTFWQNIYYEVLKVYKPEFYEKVCTWIQETYGSDERTFPQAFAKYAKLAFKEFFDEHYEMDQDFERAFEARVYAEALVFFKSFKSEGKASIVRKYLTNKRSS